MENIHRLILCRLFARLGCVRFCTLPAPFTQASCLSRNCFPESFLWKQKNSPRTCPIDISDDQSPGWLKRKAESGRKARGGASGSARLPRRRLVCGERIERAERRSRAIYRILRWKDVCLFGASGAKRRMPRRGCARGGAPKATHL